MKNSILITLTVIFGLLISSCNKTDKNAIDSKTGEPKKFSNLKVEDHKANMQDAGIQMIDEATKLAESEGVKAAVNMVSMMDINVNTNNQKSAVAKTMPVRMIYGISRLSTKNIADINSLLYSIGKLKVDGEDNGKTIEEQYLEIVAKYTWNHEKEEFDSTGSDKLIVEFPADSTSPTNNAVFTVESFNTEVYSNSALGGDQEMPVDISCNLKVNDTKVIELTLTGAYQSDGVPTSVVVKLDISGFVFGVELKNTDMKAASITYSLKHSDKTLIELSVGVNGDYSQTNIDNNTHYYKWDCSSGECVKVIAQKDDQDAFEEVDFEEIIKGGYGYIQVMDIKTGGEVNINGLAKKINKFNNDTLIPEKQNIDSIVAAMNTYINFYVAYVTEKQKIADLEFYTKEYQDTTYSYSYEYDENSGTYIEIKTPTGTETRYKPDARFIFGDGSKVDAETYFKNGFKDLIDEMNKLVADLNDMYDLKIDPIEYDGN